MPGFTREIKIAASVDEVWEVLADIGGICRWNPAVVYSEGTRGDKAGLGAGRHCSLGGKKYVDEEVVEWKPGERLTMRTVATNLPVSSADIRFTLKDENCSTRVKVTPSYDVKFGTLGKLLDLLYLRRLYRSDTRILLGGLKRWLENGFLDDD
ncbi:MAG: SRPBCC family protein [Gemmatimonadota bacterium]|nr:MAG: SRPBCC family protein [Gemmatimonadota bacterium]